MNKLCRSRSFRGAASVPRQQKGFTLLEVLVAFLILAMALGVIMHIFSLSLKTADSAAAYQRGLLLAESKLAEVMAEPDLQTGRDQGEFDQGYRWEVEVDEWQFPDQEGLTDYRYQPYHIQVLVSWGARHRQQVSLNNLVLAEENAL